MLVDDRSLRPAKRRGRRYRRDDRHHPTHHDLRQRLDRPGRPRLRRRHHPGGEECDDGNQTGNDGCASCVVKCVGKHEVKDPTTHHCYWYDKTSADSVDAATSFCAGWRPNGTLAAVTSQAELSFLTGAGGVISGTWLGANDLAKMGEYQWVTGEPWSFTDWAPGSSGGSPSERCVRLGSQGLK